MPPKGTKKEVKEPTKTPQKTKVEAKAAATPSKTTKQFPNKEGSTTTTPKKKEPAKVTKLALNKAATLPITVTFQGDNPEAKHTKAGYTHALKLDASAHFSLVDSYVIPEGQENEGFQVILVKPAQAFKFMKLSLEVRQRIYMFYCLAKGQGSLAITFDGKRKNDSKDPYAKTFAEGNSNRVGLLAVNKEINEEATPILYGRPLRFENPGLLMTFFADLESRLRVHLRHIEINQYVKKDAKTALAFLAEAKNLNHLRIDSGMAMDDNTAKVAKNFWLDASKLLEAVGSKKEKTMVEDKPKQPVAKSKVADSSDEESSEDEDAEDSEDESEEDAGGEETEEAEESKTASSSSAAQSDAVNDGTINSANVELSSNIEQMDISEGAPAATKSEDTVMADNVADNGDNTENSGVVKKDSKSPTPAVSPATKKVIAPKPGPKMRQGRKSDALDILHFGKTASKYKDEDKTERIWDVSMRAEFLDALRAKLNFMHLPVWTCICGNRLYGHTCPTGPSPGGDNKQER